MKKYFNLNNRALKSWENNGMTAVIKGVPDIFPETGEHLSWKFPAVRNEESNISVTRQLLMYTGVFIGVLLNTAWLILDLGVLI
jgi:hypothetical protein